MANTLRLIVEHMAAGLLLIPGYDCQRVCTHMDGDTEEWVTVVELPDLAALAGLIRALSPHTCKLYDAPHRWGPHWPPALRLLFLEVDDEMGRKEVVTWEVEP